MQNITHYIPILSTVAAFWFAAALYRHWRKKPSARYLLWWFIGVMLYGVGTLTESLTALLGWNIVIFKAWYISGALLGAFPLAQGTVYLLLKKRAADILAVVMSLYVAVAGVLVMLSPVNMDLVEPTRLTGKVLAWGWTRLFSPLPNTYALIFLVGGAVWSAVEYFRKIGPGNRVLGNILIAVGALLPGIGGSFTRLGYTEVLYVTEIFGILLIWGGYRLMAVADAESIHAAQQAVAGK
jgi:hypothetical protein